MMSDDSGKGSIASFSNSCWLYSAFCITFLTVCSGITFSYGVYLPSLGTEFDLELDAAAAIFSLFLLVAGISAYISSHILTRLSPRIIMPVSGIISGLGLFIASNAGSTSLFLVGFGIVSALGMGSIWIVTLYLLNLFIPKNHIVFVTIAGICSGMMIITPICGWLVASHSWDDAFLFTSILTWVVFIPIGPCIMIHRDKTNCSLGNDVINEDVTKVVTSRGKRNFWLSFGMWIFLAFTLHIVIIHIIAHATLNGISIQRASYLYSILGAVGIISALGIGSIAENFDRKSLSIIFTLVGGIAMFWVIDADQLWEYCIFMILYAPTLGGIGYFTILFTSKYITEFPISYKHVISIGGWLGGGAFGTYFGGYLFNVVGDYRFAFFIGAWACVLAGACIWHLVIPEQQSKKTIQQSDRQSD